MKREPRHFRCLTMHAERLEVDRVWSHTDALLRRLERRGGRATLFVHPFSAIEAGADLGPKLRSLVERGHEIAQHTHYYAPRPAGSTAKPVSLVDPENVVRCLDRDLAYLREAGMDPRGFVAGGWVITTAAIDWLQLQGFTYDASVRSFSLAYVNARTIAGDRWKRASHEDGVVRLPTTTPVARSFRRGKLAHLDRRGPLRHGLHPRLRPAAAALPDGCRVVVRPLGAGSVEDGRRDRQARGRRAAPTA